MLIMTGSLIGYAASNRLSERLSFIEQYIQFLNFTETQIRYSSCSLSQIMSGFMQDRKIGNMLRSCVDEMNNGKVLYEAWNNAVNGAAQEYGLKKEDEAVIKSFGDELGNSDVDGQIMNCRLNRELMTTRLNNAREERQKKSKLYVLLGVFGGTLFVLLFI